MIAVSRFNSRLHVVHVITGLTIGGAENMLLKLILNDFDSCQSWRYSVISLTTLGEIGSRLQQKGVSVYCIHMTSLISFPKVLYQLHKLLRELNPQIVQTWMVHADLLGGLAAKVASVPIVVWGVRTDDYSVESLRTRIVRFICARLSSFIPDKIICAADSARKSHIAIGYDADRMVTITNGFDLSALRSNLGCGQQIRTDACFSFEDIVIGCIGRFNPAKDHQNFIRAAGLVGRKFPQFRFLMVGRGVDENNHELMECINATDFPERFKLLGERLDPAACLDAMNIFVLPSCTEAFPNVLAEAMAMGVICVSTDVGDARILLGGYGIIVPPRDFSALAEGIESIMAMPERQRLLMIDNARSRIQSEYSMSNVSDKFSDLYGHLFDQKCSRFGDQ